MGKPPEPAEILVVTGMSGAGRSTTAKVLEDHGWYVIDNLPPTMLSVLVEQWEQAHASGRTEMPLAVVVDVRTEPLSDRFNTVLDEFARLNRSATLLFLNANDEALVRRFESVRRPHPLQGEGRMLDGIARERVALADLLANADHVIDTSHLNVHQLAAAIGNLFGEGEGHDLRLGVMSFGFKYGVPLDSDFVFDLRFLPNPFWVPELRTLTGRDGPVAEFVLAQPGADEFIAAAVHLLEVAIEGYIREGRHYVTVAVGCTGGKHRSVAIAEQLATRLATPAVDTFLVHRDLGRE